MVDDDGDDWGTCVALLAVDSWNRATYSFITVGELAGQVFVGPAGVITVDTSPAVLASGICLVISDGLVLTQP